MNQTITIAIISSLSALFGASIGLISQIIDTKYRKSQHECDIKRKQYKQFIDAMQTMMNSDGEDKSNANFINFQKETNIVILYASHDVALYIHEYFQKLLNTDHPLSSEEHKDNQTFIINSIRKDLGISKKYIDNLQLVAFRPSHLTKSVG